MEFLHPWIAAGATAAVFFVLQLRRGAPADVLFLGALMLVVVCGVIEPKQAFSGFSNPALLTIAALLAVAAGLRSTGVLDWIGERLLGTAETERAALWRLAPSVLVASAFTLNTALVAMLMPVVVDWCRKRGVSPARLLLPLSYLTILGGVCTLIGTSTTLIVSGILQRYPQLRPLGLFELGWVGLPCALAGAAVLLLAGPRLLPKRSDMLERLDEQRRDYLVEMFVRSDCPLAGKSVQEAGLRSLPGLFLIEIDRRGEVLTPVTPDDVLQAEDRLVFTGLVETIVDLEKIPGLVPAADRAYEFHPGERHQRHLSEVVLSNSSPVIDVTVKEADFRRLYDAAVVAVHRNGERLTNKIGEIRLQPGDTLLLQTRHEFFPRYRNSRDFFLISSVEGAQPRRHHKLTLSGILAGLLILWLTATSFLPKTGVWAGLGSTAAASLTIALAMIVTRCMRASEARAALDIRTLLTIAAALGLGEALRESGAAGACAKFLVDQVGANPYLLLAVLYLLTLIFTEMLTNNAVAALLLPIAIHAASEGQYDSRPFIIAITLGASLSFLTPVGYQTNLMVMGPGGYRPHDYLRCGIPVAVVTAAIALSLIPQIWPF